MDSGRPAVAEPHGIAALREMEERDLARYMRLPDSRCVSDAARAIKGDNCFILCRGDDLVERLCKVPHGDSGRRTVRMSMPCEDGESGAGAEAGAPRGGGLEIILVRGREDGGEVPAERAVLTGKTKRRLARARGGQWLRMLNLGLGVAIFATMSATFLVAVAPPLGYVFAAGSLAAAGIMLARAADGQA